ncbi:MAG: MnhB domain-containing protein [Elusimicrobiota bacterium]
MKNNSGMTDIVKTVTSLIGGAITVFGLNIILYGHISPGGGFAGGLILAFIFILYLISFGGEEAIERLPLRFDHLFDSLGALMFLLIGFAGIFFGKKFLYNFFAEAKGRPFELLSSGFIPLSNIAIGIKVGASVFLVFAVLAIFRRKR